MVYSVDQIEESNGHAERLEHALGWLLLIAVPLYDERGEQAAYEWSASIEAVLV